MDMVWYIYGGVCMVWCCGMLGYAWYGMVVWHGIVLYGIYIYVYIYILHAMVWHGGMALYSILYGIYIYI